MGNQTRLVTLFPWWLLLILLIAIGFAVFGVWLYKRALRRGTKALFKEKFRGFLTRHQLFFSHFGLVATNPLGKSFLHALKMMRIFVGGPQFKYTLPWIVMMGGSASGKSSILRSLGLDRPIRYPEEEREGKGQPLCDWWFYDHGVVLDLDGKLVLNATYPTSDDSNWSFFLSLLRHFRPRRPLDAVVLTIPASEFIGSAAFSQEDIILRAETLYRKLWQMQRVTGLKVPLYIVISKCDLVPGFEDLCRALPLSCRPDIFGWSSDKGVGSLYGPEWVKEAFASLEASLDVVQQEIYAEGQCFDGVDGVFVFPISFAHLKKGIQTYTDHIFKSSSFHESFFMRGLYFVGDSHCARNSVPAHISADSSWTMDQKREEDPLNIYFSTDLFEKKIFREGGLARPVARVLLGGNTTNRSAKIGIAAAAIFGTLALLKANQTLQGVTKNLMSVLPHMESTLNRLQSRNSDTAVGRAYFAEQAQALLQTMAQAKVNVLFSYFLIPSWFSTLDDHVRDAMVVVYDKVIFRSIAYQLTYKAENLVSLGNNKTTLEEGLSTGLNPLLIHEFYHLNSYVEKMYALQLAVNKFNSLGVNSALSDVADIIYYLFDYKMPDDFFSDNYYYTCALNTTKVRLFKFSTYQENATLKLAKFFGAFQTAAFNPNTMIPGLAPLMVSFRDFSQTYGHGTSGVNLVRDIFTGLDQTLRSLNNPELQWLNQGQFVPGFGYETLMKLIGFCEFFIEKNVQDLTMRMDQDFTNFRRRLAGYTSPLLGKNSLFSTERELALAAPSAAALTLKNSLRDFFNEPFMAPSSNKKIIEGIPVGSILLWDTLRLQEAVALIATYNDFLNSRLLKIPKPLQPLFQKLAREGLIDSLVDLLAAAQTLGSALQGGNSFSPEDGLMPQVQNYRVVAPFLEKILETLWINNGTEAFGSLKKILFSETYGSLEKLDVILREEIPYGLKMDSFSWWKGQNKAALEAFGVSNETELKHYLALQRDRLHYLTREFADPLVSFLERMEQEGMPKNAPLVAKWQEIITAFNGYDRNTAGNSLRGLEAFIEKPLNEVTLETCQATSIARTALDLHYDFFTETLLEIQEKLHDQCRLLSGTVSIEQYSHVASFFNANLAGRFPFVAKAEGASPDACPEDLRTFFGMMDTKAKGIKNTLAQAVDLGPAGKKALMFIEQMENLRNFFGDYLVPTAASPEPAFNFDVTFRVNKEREARANEVLTWDVESNNTLISMRSPSHKGYWKAGDPVKVSFYWASNSPLQPRREGSASDLSVFDEKASYTYKGTWALLRLLRRHQASPSDFKTLVDETPTTLRFDIPLRNVNSESGKPCGATLFVRLALSPAKPKQIKKESGEKKEAASSVSEIPEGGGSLALPYFPFHAPDLSSAVYQSRS